MGQCMCKCRDGEVNAVPYGSTTADHGHHHRRQSRSSSVVAATTVDVGQLIGETLISIRNLVNNECQMPQSLAKLNVIAERDIGWLLVCQTMIEKIPVHHPLGLAVIMLFLDEAPLPTKETVLALITRLDLGRCVKQGRPTSWHRNTCIVLACLADKLVGANSAAIFTPDTIDYILSRLDESKTESVVTLSALLALEKFCQTSVNRSIIGEMFSESGYSELMKLEGQRLPDEWVVSGVSNTGAFSQHQAALCAQHLLDNVFTVPDRPYTHQLADTRRTGALLNQEDVSEYLKIAPNGLEARCDVQSFESVRCTYEINQGVWYYEAQPITNGVMQIGWATRHSKFLNHDGYGIGDDQFSVAYDGGRQYVWYNAQSVRHEHPGWKAGDILGCLLNVPDQEIIFSLNGVPLEHSHTEIFANSTHGFFAAASFMTFQHCRFNFGRWPFKYPPRDIQFSDMNSFGSLTDAQRTIVPKRRKIQMMESLSIPDDACQLCFAETACIRLEPCGHRCYCTSCSLKITHCAMCRTEIAVRVPTDEVEEPRPTTSSHQPSIPGPTLSRPSTAYVAVRASGDSDVGVDHPDEQTQITTSSETTV